MLVIDGDQEYGVGFVSRSCWFGVSDVIPIGGYYKLSLLIISRWHMASF